MTDRPLLALTTGDVAGISPEIVAKAVTRPEVHDIARVIVVGDEGFQRRAVAAASLDVEVRRIEGPDEFVDDPGCLNLLQPGDDIDPADAPVGQVSAAAGDGSVRFVRAACTLGRDGVIDGIVTAPLNKAAMHAAGHLYPGHTELLAEEFGVERYALVLAAERLCIFHVTTHVSLRDACDLVTTERTLDTIRLANAFAGALGDQEARIGVAGLNPHAGESGLFGDEDDTQIRPAVEAARAEGIDVHGPLPGDALIPAAVQGTWDYVVATFHDQGHVPFKSVYGDDGVNITAGLPVVRVSVDHGTAFDIAGQGIAREDSLVLAIRRAVELAPGWSRIWEVANR